MRGLSVVAVVILMSSSSAVADEPKEARQREADRILNGMRADRQRLMSGVFDVTGSAKTRRNGAPEVNSDVVGHYAFDRAKNRLRYDNEESQYRKVVERTPGVVVTKDSLKQFEGNIRRSKVKHVRNAEYAATWHSLGDDVGGNIELVPPHSKTDYFSESHHMFDVRSIGLMGYLEWVGCKPLEEIADWLKKLPVDELKREGTRVSLRMSDATFVVDATIETDSGFRPVSFRVRSNNPTDVQFDSGMKVKWGRRNGTDVPEEMEYSDDIPDRSHHTEYRLKLDWKSVNEPVDVKEFDYLSFRGLPKGGRVSVFDGRDPKRTVHLGDWIEDGVVKSPE